MRQTSCKRLSLFIVIFFFVSLFAKAQDSTKVPSPTPAAKSTKAITSVPSKTTSRGKTITSVQKKPSVSSVSAKATRDTAAVVNAPATVKAPPRVTDNSLKGQYEDLLRYSWIQKNYRVVTPNRLTSLWKSVSDSLKAKDKTLAVLKQKTGEQEKQIAELKGGSSAQSQTEASTPASSNTVDFMGMPLEQATYNWIVWGIIMILGLGLVGVLFTTTKNSGDAKHHRQLYEDVSAEYQTYKAKSKEKEQKLARELQTERNTIEELQEEIQARKSGEEPVKRGRGKS